MSTLRIRQPLSQRLTGPQRARRWAKILRRRDTPRPYTHIAIPDRVVSRAEAQRAKSVADQTHALQERLVAAGGGPSKLGAFGWQRVRRLVANMRAHFEAVAKAASIQRCTHRREYEVMTKTGLVKHRGAPCGGRMRSSGALSMRCDLCGREAFKKAQKAA